MDLPLLFYRVCYVLGTVLLLGAELLALIDPGGGDTITEHVRPVIQSNTFGWFLAAALLTWLGWHFLIEPARSLP